MNHEYIFAFLLFYWYNECMYLVIFFKVGREDGDPISVYNEQILWPCCKIWTRRAYLVRKQVEIYPTCSKINIINYCVIESSSQSLKFEYCKALEVFLRYISTRTNTSRSMRSSHHVGKFNVQQSSFWIQECVSVTTFHVYYVW